MKKTIGVILVLAILLMTLTGCMKADYNVKVNSDGSAEITYIYAVQKSFIEQMNSTYSQGTESSYSSEKFIEEAKTESEKSGYTVEKYETEDLSGIKSTKKVEDVSTIDLKEAFGENLTQSENGGIVIKKGILFNKYSQNLIIKSSEDQDLSQYGVEATYSITLPIKANSNNADSVSEDGKTLTWNLANGGEKSIQFEANQLSILIIIIAAVVVLAIIATVVIIIVIKSKKKVEE